MKALTVYPSIHANLGPYLNKGGCTARNKQKVTSVTSGPDHIRVATAQGKQGIWFLLFPDRENTGNFVLTQGKIC